MPATSDQLRLILGVKLKTLRQEQRLGLKDVADRANVSISYLSEIEKGKKYPKPEKLIELADALGVAYDDLVSLRVGEELTDLKNAIDSPFLREFPFHLFGVSPEDIVSLVAGKPDQGGALLRTFLEVLRTYDLRMEDFLFGALRAHQQLNDNYFEELEDEATRFREAQGWDAAYVPTVDDLSRLLADYHIGPISLTAFPDLDRLRSIYVPPRRGARGTPPRLLLNPKLLPSQVAFILARELGYRLLGLHVRPLTSSWVKIESFEQVLNHFKASYVGGAVLMGRDAFRADLAEFIAKPIWNAESFGRGLARYNATPEMLFYRLTQVIPRFFGLREIYFMRFSHKVATDEVKLTKVLNLSRVPVPHGISGDEHFCRRGVALRSLDALAKRQATTADPAPVILAQRIRYTSDNAEFFVISVARPLALKPGTNSAVSLGFRMDDAFRRTVRFWDDPAVPTTDVNLTCERCPLADCLERVAPPAVLAHDARINRQQDALDTLLAAF